MSHSEETQLVFDIIEKNPICMLTVQCQDGPLQSRPMTVVKTENNEQIWIITTADSEPATEIAQDAQVNLTFSGSGQWLSVHGSAAIIKSEPKARELWNKAVDAFIPEGPASQNVALIRIRPEGAQYWTSPGGALAMAFQWAKAQVTDSQIDAGESGTVAL